ncbi:hypothetical protein RRG08_030527 [Elysia crispata]|uniref:Uncharacterized protein n=1 Tax=Elysia crispata TaxID=231223 RepID=A0AAE0YMQ3_9GAST|nr:hypothetical protein RRG08_030527 [Elysia crispata]
MKVRVNTSECGPRQTEYLYTWKTCMAAAIFRNTGPRQNEYLPTCKIHMSDVISRSLVPRQSNSLRVKFTCLTLSPGV